MPPSPHTQLFTTALKLVMERNGKNQSQLAAATTIAVSRINNYLHGNYRTIRPDHLERIVQAVARNAKERSELVRAYLLDLLPEVLQSETKIGCLAAHATQSKDQVLDLRELPKSAAEALATMRVLSLRNAKARFHMEWFSEVLAEGHAK